MVYRFEDGEGGEVIAIALTGETIEDSTSDDAEQSLEEQAEALGFEEQGEGIWYRDYGEKE